MATSPCFSIIGLPGVGKTTLGRKLASELGFRFMDTDEEFERMFGQSPKECILAEGENAFRDKETECLKAILDGRDGGMVLATGGGIVLREENRRQLRLRTKVIYLKTEPAEINLSEEEIEKRPLLKNLPELYRIRKPFYEECAEIILTPSETFWNF